MKKIIALAAIVLAITTSVLGQCTPLFSFAAYFNTVTFLNQSSVSHAHYFWNFGDGTGSNIANPIHTFPDDGDYLVTLFAEDTVSNCSSYYEYWVDVTKYST
jgi:PKD repeat protein